MFSLHSMVTSREVHSPSSCDLAMQVSVNCLFGDVVIASGEVSTDRPTSVRERHTYSFVGNIISKEMSGKLFKGGILMQE